MIAALPTIAHAQVHGFFAGPCDPAFPAASTTNAYCWDAAVSSFKYWNGSSWIPAIGNIWTGSAPALATTGSQTNYLPVSGLAALSATEGPAQQPIAKVVVINNLQCAVTASAGIGKADIWTLDLNGAPTALTCVTIGGVNATCSDLTHQVTTTVGSLLDYSVVTGASGGSFNARSGGCSFNMSF